MDYKKMAGTSAVFVFANEHANSPVEREGLIWNDGELHLGSLPNSLTPKEAMATSLALEGLEEYDPPQHGDLRTVTSLQSQFAYIEQLKGWVEIGEP